MLMINTNEYKACRHSVNATRVIVSVLGVILALSGICHGFFEALQGNTPIKGLIINAIGEANRMWVYGNEPAFTLIPNFFITGIASIIVSLAIIIWSVGFIDRRNGPLIFLLLFILLFLVGGGIGQVIFFTLIWAFATRINKPLTWWRRTLPVSVRKTLARQWRSYLAISSILILFALEVAVFGIVPGISDPDSITIAMLTSLGFGLLFMLLAFVSGFAHEIEKKEIYNYE